MGLTPPNVTEWLNEAKNDEKASQVGMYLIHNGTVREEPKKQVREGIDDGSKVVGMNFDYDEAKVNAAIEEAYTYPGIKYIRAWLNKGELQVGDDIMYILVGGDIRPNVISGLEKLVEKIKTTCVVEDEHLTK